MTIDFSKRAILYILSSLILGGFCSAMSPTTEGMAVFFLIIFFIPLLLIDTIVYLYRNLSNWKILGFFYSVNFLTFILFWGSQILSQDNEILGIVFLLIFILAYCYSWYKFLIINTASWNKFLIAHIAFVLYVILQYNLR